MASRMSTCDVRPHSRLGLGVVREQHDAARLREVHGLHLNGREEVLEDGYEELEVTSFSSEVVEDELQVDRGRVSQ